MPVSDPNIAHVYEVLRQIEKKLDRLLAKKDISNDERLLIMKDKFDAWSEEWERKLQKKTRNWVSEKEATQLLGGIKEKTLRKNVKEVIWRIKYTCPNGRNFQYWKPDIDKLLNDHSNRPWSKG